MRRIAQRRLQILVPTYLFLSHQQRPTVLLAHAAVLAHAVIRIVRITIFLLHAFLKIMCNLFANSQTTWVSRWQKRAIRYLICLVNPLITVRTTLCRH
jgi:hypothetical protein